MISSRNHYEDRIFVVATVILPSACSLLPTATAQVRVQKPRWKDSPMVRQKEKMWHDFHQQIGRDYFSVSSAPRDIALDAGNGGNRKLGTWDQSPIMMCVFLPPSASSAW